MAPSKRRQLLAMSAAIYILRKRRKRSDVKKKNSTDAQASRRHFYLCSLSFFYRKGMGNSELFRILSHQIKVLRPFQKLFLIDVLMHPAHGSIKQCCLRNFRG